MGFQSPQADLLPRHVAIIGDEKLSRGHGVSIAHIYPGTGSVTREITLGGPADVDAAVAAARKAAPAWRALPGNQRRDLMLKLAQLIETESDSLCQLITAENGTPIMAAPFTTADAVQKFRYFGGWADKIQGSTIKTWAGPAHDYIAYEPYGVVGAIIPWNGPLFATTMVIAPALAAGNCVVVKAPELAPYTVLRLGELILQAGFPAGVVNVVAGGPDVGEAMVLHPGIDKIQFVGSGATAKKVLAAAAGGLKPCGLELGGKSAVIVFADAELMPAAQSGLSGAIAVSGQGCVNGTRLLVQRPIYEQYVETLKSFVDYIKVGDPMDAGTVMGPIISQVSLDRICGMVGAAKAAGSRVVTGGAERLGGDYASGFFLPLTIVADVDHKSALAQNEVFGPVLAITPFDTEDEAIALANDTPYGLGAYIHTQNLRRGHYVAEQMQAGMIHVNGSGQGMVPNAPFGGWKQSGFGRLGGEAGLHEFLQIKNVWMNLAKSDAAQ